RREVDTIMRDQAERILGELDLVRREEFEAVREMAALARAENERLAARIAALESRLGAGKMGGALLQGWLGLGLDPATVVVRDPAPPPEVRAAIAERRIALNPPSPVTPAV